MATPPASTGIECLGHVEAPAGAVWRTVGDFGSDWHPAMAACRLETRAGAVERVFRVAGGNEFRERQTFRSDSERRLTYRMMAGSSVLDRYEAELSVEDDGAGARIAWRAELAGPDAAAVKSSAEETRAIFEAGIAFVRQRMTLRTETIEVPHRLALLATGEGQVVLFLHGIGGRKENWRRQLQDLAMRATAVALDVRGYGGSSRAPEGLGLEDHFADILSVMTHFQAPQIHLVGLSYGSWIAASFAHQRPELVASLTLSGGCTGMTEAPPEVVAGFRAAREAPLDKGLTPADMASEIVRMLAGPHCPPEAEVELAASMSAIGADAYRAAIRCFTAPPFRLDFARWEMPVLLMTGEHDRLAAPAEIASVAGRVRAARAGAAAPAEVVFEVIEQAGHLCNLEAPEAYGAHLRAFIGQHVARQELRHG